MDETWRAFTIAMIVGILIGALMLLIDNNDASNKLGNITVGGGAVDSEATHRTIRGGNVLWP